MLDFQKGDEYFLPDRLFEGLKLGLYIKIQAQVQVLKKLASTRKVPKCLKRLNRRFQFMKKAHLYH